MSAELLQLLIESALASSVALLLVLALRHGVRRAFGARVAYALWLLVPATIVAVLLPAASLPPAAIVATQAAAGRVGAITAIAATGGDVAPWLVGLWGFGAVFLALALLRSQRRFHEALGPLQPRADGSWHSQSDRIGPAVIGALRGRVVVPADFDTRYDAVQRDLVLRHERVHVARYDLAANLAATALRCVHWFNPLHHYALARFRFDQELAADAVVLAQKPQARRDYADAMLKTQLLDDPPPLGCHWQPVHPLKERILMLKQPLPGARRAAFGAIVAIALMLSTGYLAWAAQPAQPGLRSPAFAPADEVLRVTLTRNGKAIAQAHVPAKVGALAPLVTPDGLEFEYRISELAGDKLHLEAVLRRDGSILGKPSLIFIRGAVARIAIDDIACDFEWKSWGELSATGGAPEAVVTDVSYARLSPPAYPGPALADKVQGTVMLRVLVEVDGSPREVIVDTSSGDARLDQAAVAKVRSSWRFNPLTQDGKPAAKWVQVPITFSLDGPPAESVPTAANRLDEIYIAPKQ